MPSTFTIGEGATGLVPSTHARSESEHSRNLGLGGSNRGLSVESVDFRFRYSVFLGELGIGKGGCPPSKVAVFLATETESKDRSRCPDKRLLSQENRRFHTKWYQSDPPRWHTGTGIDTPNRTEPQTPYREWEYWYLSFGDGIASYCH